GIRDFHVTGVQTCALPISPQKKANKYLSTFLYIKILFRLMCSSVFFSFSQRYILRNIIFFISRLAVIVSPSVNYRQIAWPVSVRSEDRRVGRDSRVERSRA